MPNPDPLSEVPSEALPKRRGFLRWAAAAAAAGVITRNLPGQGARSAPNEDWLKGLGTTHRQFFDCPGIGVPILGRLQTFLDVYNQSYGVADSDVGAIVGCHGDGIGFVLGDEAWQRFELGTRFNVSDPATGKPAVRNIFGDFPSQKDAGQGSIAGLRKRGVRFIGCNSTLRRLSRALASTSASSDEVHAALTRSVLAGIQIVPAMIVAGNRAQESGFSYVSMR